MRAPDGMTVQATKQNIHTPVQNETWRQKKKYAVCCQTFERHKKNGNMEGLCV
jgi:hypothetical protein